MSQEKGKRCNSPTTEGDDTMSAVTQNFVYQVCGKKDSQKKEPTVSQNRLAEIKKTVGKYLSENK